MATKEVRVLQKDLPAPESGVHINSLLYKQQGACAERRRRRHVASFTCENLPSRMRAVEVAPSSPLVPKSTSKRARSGPMFAVCHMDDVPCRKSGVDGHRSSERIIGWRQELCWRRGRLRRRVTQSHRNHRRRTGVVVWYMCAPRGVEDGVSARVLGRLSVDLFCLRV